MELEQADFLEDCRGMGELFLKTAGMSGFEYKGQIHPDVVGVQWERKAGQVVPAIMRVCSSPATVLDKYAVMYQRRIARSTGELVGMANLVTAVHDAAFPNGWDQSLENTALYLSSRNELTVANHKPAAESLAVLDKFISMYLREL